MSQEQLIVFLFIVVGTFVLYWVTNKSHPILMEKFLGNEDLEDKTNEVMMERWQYVRRTFFTNNMFDFAKFQDFIVKVDKMEGKYVDVLIVLSNLVCASTSLRQEFIESFFLMNFEVKDPEKEFKEVVTKINAKKYKGTVR